MAPPALAYVYTDRSSVERLLSEAAVILRLDDDGDSQAVTGDTAKLQDAMDLATETVNYYCYPFYRDVRLAVSNLVWRWTTILAAYDLDRRRNNPPSETLAAWAEEIQAKLEDVQAERAQLPGVPRRSSGVPKVANYRIDQRFQFRVIRVEKRGSSSFSAPMATDYAESFCPEI